MDEDLKEKIALFRYGIIAELIGRVLAPREKEKLLSDIAAKEWTIPGSRRTRIGRSTVRDWIELHQTHGFEGLKPGEEPIADGPGRSPNKCRICCSSSAPSVRTLRSTASCAPCICPAAWSLA